MEKILIKNFKAIKNTKSVEIPIKNLLLMIGDNASGKSTVATLVYFSKSLKNEIFDFVLKEDFVDFTFANNLLNRLRKYFVTLLGATRHLDNFTITYYFDNNSIILNQTESGNLGISYQPQQFFNQLKNLCVQVKNELKIAQDIPNQVFAQSERQRLILQLYNGLNQLFGMEDLLYFLPNRNIMVSLEHRLLPIYSQLENNLLNGKDDNISNNDLLLLNLINYFDKILLPKYKKNGGFEQLLQSESDLSGLSKAKITYLKEILPQLERIIRGKYVFDNYGEKILYEGKNPNKYIHLNNASSGQEEIIRIIQDFFLVALQNKTVIRIIDEPESHLFPIRQKEFVELCAWLINANPQNKLILPTHSPYILTALNNCLYAGNIAKTKPTEVERVIPKHFWLTSEQVSAFMLKDGEFENLIDESSETKLIEASRIDEVSQILNDTLDQLIEIDNA